MSLYDPHAIIEIEGQTFDSFRNKSFFSSLNVQLTTNEASQVDFTVIDELYDFLNGFARSDGVPLAPALVWLGFGNDLGEPVFDGLLAGVGHGDDKSTLKFFDRSLLMRLHQKTEYHKGLDVDVIKKLGARNGLEFEGPGSSFKGLPLKSKKQEAQTDWEFAMSLAEDAGLVLFVRGNTLFAKLPARTGEPAISFGRRDARVLRSTDQQYKVPENIEGRPRRVEVRGRGRGGKRLTGVSDESRRGHTHVVINRSIKHASATEARRRAQAKKELKREHAFNCRIRSLLQVQPHVDVRQTIELLDHGLIFSGKYLVDKVEHSFGPGKLETDYDLYRDIEDIGRF